VTIISGCDNNNTRTLEPHIKGLNGGNSRRSCSEICTVLFKARVLTAATSKIHRDVAKSF
jgi:hypothetical protein